MDYMMQAAAEQRQREAQQADPHFVAVNESFEALAKSLLIAQAAARPGTRPGASHNVHAISDDQPSSNFITSAPASSEPGGYQN